ncbi:PulJ/GspJ family protein [Undibacterium sp.]|jgi:general secretion pathway protein J|uniref:PulJ/GspJ family protein n=1 Tax=Undibacterium sp. TaxID=1914977 RepID=UPI002C00C4A7|nr:prepilin-type N-terminal cleavage/methylation domain-containing protein [Undibacterium sp.]HTD02349.1 prepilin-type N-terminal cleavage/methylation domain-containing protein [Undibacterium sp.]
MRFRASTGTAPLRISRGFTLIELLVAITILAIVAVLGWRGLDSIVRARVALTSSMEQTRGTQISFAQLENDSEHVAGPDLLPLRETLRASQQHLTLIRTVFDDNQPTRLQVVAYRLQDGVLSRRESLPTRDLNMLDAYWQNALNDSDNMPVVALQTNVAALDMRTWNIDENGWRIAGSDIPAPSSNGDTKVAAPKKGLEVSLKLSGQERPMLKVFLVGAV